MPISEHASSLPTPANIDWLERVQQQLGVSSLTELDEQVGADAGAGLVPDQLATTSARNGWQLGAYVETGSNAATNAYAREEVAGGAEALLFRLYQQPFTKDIEALLRGIDAERVSLHCSLRYPGQDPAELFRDLVRFLRKADYDLTKTSGSVDFDPLLDWSEPPFPPLIRLLFFVSRWMPGFRVLQVNAAGFNNGIEGADLELALALAKGSQYLEELKSRGYPPALANRHLQFALTVGTSFHGDIAKLHALRILWAQVLQEFGIDNPGPVQIAVHSDIVTLSGDADKDLSDLYLQALSSAHGGADLLFLAPAADHHQSASLSGRVYTRNVQHQIRQEGAQLSAKSSEAVALLSEALVKATWLRYRSIQEQGGFMEAADF
ncbi:MAG: methylmalonyl-CoA mutase family protein [Bacteroidota bacterium]